MTRGNQRELARKKNEKKKTEQIKAKGKNAGVSKDKRMQTDADIMRQKQMASQAKKDGGPSTSKE